MAPQSISKDLLRQTNSSIKHTRFILFLLSEENLHYIRPFGDLDRLDPVRESSVLHQISLLVELDGVG